MAITSRALAFAQRWFDAATVQRIFEPLVADWQREWQDASPSCRARVSIRGLAAFICAVMVSSPSLLQAHAPSSVTNRVAVRMTRFIALSSLLLIQPFLPQIQNSGWRLIILIAVVPQAITAVFPFAMIGAVDAIRRYEPLAPHVERALVAKLGVIALLFMIVFGGFVVPAGNQLFRRGITLDGPPPVRGVRELTTYQLITDPTLAAPQEPYTGGADRATRIQRELNNRAAIALVPLLLLWLRWRAIDTGLGKWWSPFPAPLATTFVVAAFVATYLYGFLLEGWLHLPAGTGHWLPIVTFAIWTATSRSRQRGLRRVIQSSTQ
jgi:hypothetical protein